MPLEKTLQRCPRLCSLTFGVPRDVELQARPHRVNPRGECVEVGGPGAGRHCLGERVHDRAKPAAWLDPRCRAPPGRGTTAAGSCRAVSALRKRDRRVRGAHRHVAGRTARQIPTRSPGLPTGTSGRPSAIARPRAGPAGAARLPTTSLASWSVLRPQVGDESGWRAGDRYGRWPRSASTPSSARNRLGRSPPSSGDGDGGDDEPPPRPRDRDVEEPALLGEQRAPAAGGRSRPPAGSTRPRRSEDSNHRDGAGPARLFLHPGDDHEIPLQSLGAVRGQQTDGVGRDRLLGEGVGRDLLRLDLLDEGATPTPRRRSTARAAMSKRATTASRSASARRPAGRRGGVRLDRRGHGVADHSAQRAASTVPPSPWTAVTRSKSSRSRTSGRTISSATPSSNPDRVPRSRAGPRTPRAHCRQRPAPGRTREAPARAGAAARGSSRRAESRGGPAPLRRSAGREPQRRRPEQQGSDGGFTDQGHLVTGDVDRHAGGRERAAQGGDRAHARSDEHRHRRPGDAVLQVRASQQVGDRLDLGAGGRRNAKPRRRWKRRGRPRPASAARHRALHRACDRLRVECQQRELLGHRVRQWLCGRCRRDRRADSGERHERAVSTDLLGLQPRDGIRSAIPPERRAARRTHGAKPAHLHRRGPTRRRPGTGRGTRGCC